MRAWRMTVAVTPVLAIAVPLATPASAAPPDERVANVDIVSFPLALPKISGPVSHFDVREVSQASGDGLSLTSRGDYTCVEVDVAARHTITCHGTVQGTGTIDGVAGVVRSHVTIRCEVVGPDLTCAGTSQVKGISGGLTSVRGTGTFTSALLVGTNFVTTGRGTQTLRLTRS